MSTTIVLEDDELLLKAQDITHLPENSTLVKEALKALIARENTKQSALLGEHESQVELSTKTIVDFLGSGKAYSRFSSSTEVDNFIAENREKWEP